VEKVPKLSDQDPSPLGRGHVTLHTPHILGAYGASIEPPAPSGMSGYGPGGWSWKSSEITCSFTLEFKNVKIHKGKHCDL